MEHGGSGYAYSNLGCRCDECREAHRLRIARRTAERRLELPKRVDQLPHGTRSTYSNWGCRCAACTEANAKACADYAKRRRDAE